ncbi:hypothetical protein Tco_1423394, partial [Tanacetum coccineum]
MHGFPRYHMLVPGFPWYPMQDPSRDSANRKKNRLSGEDGSSESDDESRKSDEEGSEYDEKAETTPIENKKCKKGKYWNMPPLLKTPFLDINSKK